MTSLASATDDPAVAVSFTAEAFRQLQAEKELLERDKAALQDRLDFVEELLGPTEAQRKAFQEQIAAARAAALHARHCGVAVPTRFLGRLDECWLRSRGLSERDCAVLQRGCVSGPSGVPRDVSLLGDPAFRPFDAVTMKPLWEARGGLLRLSLGDVRSRWGEEVALEVVRCAIELDRHDASRRLGVELPWNAEHNRELTAAEVIAFMEREVTVRFCTDECDTMEEEFLSETSSTQDQDFLSEMPPSPAWSMLESCVVGPEGLDIASLAASAAAGAAAAAAAFAATTSTASPELPLTALGAGGAGDPAPREEGPGGPLSGRGSMSGGGQEQERYEWSLADADIEQLLRQPPGRKAVEPRPLRGAPAAGAAASAAPAPAAESAPSSSSDVDDLYSAFLEEDVLSTMDTNEADGGSSAADFHLTTLIQLLEEEVAGFREVSVPTSEVRAASSI